MNKIQIQHHVTETIQSDPFGDNIQSISLVGSFLSGNATEYSNFDAVVMQLINIGEMANHLCEEFIETHCLLPIGTLNETLVTI